jgi:excisionase family DNA binding protein
MRLLTVKEVAEILKAKSSTVYSWAEQGIIPCFKLNGLLRFSEDDIFTWIKNCKKNPVERYNISAGRRLRKGG